MSVPKIRWGILGVAGINNRLLPSFGRARNADLRAIASRSLEKAQRAATAAAIPVAHGSYQAMLDDPEIDAVYIPLPNTLHDEWTRKAADAGKHILCEKPLTPTAAEAEQLVDYCRAKGVCLMDGFMWPHHPRTHRLREFLDEGSIGEVRHVSATFTFPMRPMDPSNIRLQPALAGGCLLDVGCYPVFGIRWAMKAEPVEAFAQAVMKHGVEIEMTGQLRFAGGQLACFDCGFTMPVRQRMEIAGTEGVVSVPEMWVPGARATYLVRREARPVEEVLIEGEDQMQHMIEDLGRAILDKTPVYPDPTEAVRSLRVMDALARSAREGKPVSI